MNSKVKKYTLLLGSKSPRRIDLLKKAGFNFKILPFIETDETIPIHMHQEEIPVYLACKKAEAYRTMISDNQVLITADTIVVLNENIMVKPKDENEAFRMLMDLSGKSHLVITGVCLTSKEKQKQFYDITRVYFKTLDKEEIDYYIKTHKPFDKAGAYGIQEWIGYIGVEKIEGSYENVIGLPVQKLYNELIDFF